MPIGSPTGRVTKRVSSTGTTRGVGRPASARLESLRTGLNQPWVDRCRTPVVSRTTTVPSAAQSLGTESDSNEPIAMPRATTTVRARPP